MNKFFLLAGLALSNQAHALTLASGETANINGTSITCSSGDKCGVIKSSCPDGHLEVMLSGVTVNGCEWQDDALRTLKTLRDAGACR